jgi:hypothetical protein
MYKFILPLPTQHFTLMSSIFFILNTRSFHYITLSQNSTHSSLSQMCPYKIFIC